MHGDELLLTFGDEQAALREFARLYREYAEAADSAEAEERLTGLQHDLSWSKYSRSQLRITSNDRMPSMNPQLPLANAS